MFQLCWLITLDRILKWAEIRAAIKSHKTQNLAIPKGGGATKYDMNHLGI